MHAEPQGQKIRIPWIPSQVLRAQGKKIMEHLVRFLRGDAAGASSSTCFERVVRRGARGAGALPPRGSAAWLGSSCALPPSPSVRTSTLVVAGAVFAKGLDTVQQSAPSEALRARCHDPDGHSGEGMSVQACEKHHAMAAQQQ